MGQSEVVRRRWTLWKEKGELPPREKKDYDGSFR